MRADPAFRDVTSDSQNRGLQATLDIDRDKAGVLGVAVGDLRTALYNAYGDRQIGSIYGASNTYQVILSAADDDRQFEEDVSRLSVRSTRPGSWCRCRPSRPSSARWARLRSTTRASCRR